MGFSQIGRESAIRIAQAWNPDRSLRENMAAAGIEGEDNPVNHRQGFVVFTVDGQDIYPELVEVKNHQARFRGRVYKA